MSWSGPIFSASHLFVLWRAYEPLLSISGNKGPISATMCHCACQTINSLTVMFHICNKTAIMLHDSFCTVQPRKSLFSNNDMIKRSPRHVTYLLHMGDLLFARHRLWYKGLPFNVFSRQNPAGMTAQSLKFKKLFNNQILNPEPRVEHTSTLPLSHCGEHKRL